MEGSLKAPDPVVIGQDEGTEVHVQAVTHSIKPRLAIRLWRRTPNGFAPSGNGLSLTRADLEKLYDGIAELLEASSSGRQVARVVWEIEPDRRLRAEIEPFGTRYVARLGLWQRVRSTWRPADDGLVLAADRLQPLQEALGRFRPWMASVKTQDTEEIEVVQARDSLMRWPAPGADWLTVEGDSLAFHPRGVRITCAVHEGGGRHWLVLRQWRRQESLWLPETVNLSLSILDLDTLLIRLRHMADRLQAGEIALEEEFSCVDGSTLRVAVMERDSGVTLRIRQATGSSRRDLAFEPRISMPIEHILRFGRALTQCWTILFGWLSERERHELQDREKGEPAQQSTAEQPESIADGEPQAVQSEAKEAQTEEPEAEETEEGEATEEVHLPAAERSPEETAEPAPFSPPQVFSFAAESEAPGVILAGADGICIAVEGGKPARSVRVPIAAAGKVLSGLIELDATRRRQERVDPVLLCDLPDCAVYGRVGTPTLPQVIELRVWSGPTASEAISFDVHYLPELIEGMQRALLFMGQDVPGPAPSIMLDGHPPASLSDPRAPAHVRPIAPGGPLQRPGPISSPDAPPSGATPLEIALGTAQLGRQCVALNVRGHSECPLLSLEWDGQSLELPMERLDEMLTDVRALYYDALRGRRGRSLSVGEYPVVTISVRNQGPQLYFWLQQEIDGESTALSFPASEVPGFLDAARAALTAL